MFSTDSMKTKGIIQPTAGDSPAQKQRWMLLDMHRYWWQVTGCKDIRAINQLTQDIRREWLERRTNGKGV